ncbi:unnamed protein product [Phytophthora fragariaefolia]|uniref:Unnamed protein product n=1 Tax=Phytophthora fragariaefolia TaxID=1490495 RepID=A0A9W7D752_9STRA|nr:unnamed protein product [Phytophthora fragariaefolia]
MAALSVKYQVKDLGHPSQFLGMRIEQSDKGILVSQAAYVGEALHRSAMQPARMQPTPMIPNTRLDEFQDSPPDNEDAEMRRMPYRHVVGSLLYTLKVAWIAAKYLLRYLSGTQTIRLRLAPSSSGIDVVTDADLANNKADRKSVSDCLDYLFAFPVAWSSTKHGVVAQYSTTAELIAANDGLLLAKWIKLVVDEILHQVLPPTKLTLQVDNVPTIHRIKHEGSSGAQKAVDICFRALKDAWKHDDMAIEYIPTEVIPADKLTKSLTSSQLRNKRGSISTRVTIRVVACVGGVEQGN